MKNSIVAVVSLLLFLSVGAFAQGTNTRKDSPHLVLGTQTIDGSYGFTQESRLVETARRILEMGSDSIKFSFSNRLDDEAAPKNLAEVARLNPSIKTVLALPFSNLIFWAYPVQQTGDMMDARNLDANYREINDLTRYLLTTFKGSGKTFYLGHWEGDWYLLHMNPDYTPTEAEIKAITDWAKIRQQAVDDAKRDTPHSGVEVYSYLEVNRVQDAIAGKARLANRIVPAINPDFVSYSAYDSLDDVEKQLPVALDYLQRQLKPKTGLPSKRVWIGEYGFPAVRYSPEEQDRQSRRVMRVALDWGCPFALYWEFYNNEVENGKQKGFWMVNDKNEPQPIYHTHQQFYQKARDYITDFRRQHGKAPTDEEFNLWAKEWLSGE